MNWGKTVTGLSAAMLVCMPAAMAEVAPGDVKIEDLKVAAAITDQAGNPEEGAKAFKDTKGGNCLACHANKAMPKDLFQGNVGPALDGVAGRYEPALLRAILVNSKAVFGPQTVMPGFYTLDVGKNVREESVGKTVLTAQQVEDIVAYLGTLKE
ncbi:MAG: sulfur oxidation c-type cytochrome SoxX [Phyllobacteriaceae bacterium]|nr:sulfur oxidation c-type cytochrome SoxX [Phyllobacteriaceae bacterium]